MNYLKSRVIRKFARNRVIRYCEVTSVGQIWEKFWKVKESGEEKEKRGSERKKRIVKGAGGREVPLNTPVMYDMST